MIRYRFETRDGQKQGTSPRCNLVSERLDLVEETSSGFDNATTSCLMQAPLIPDVPRPGHAPSGFSKRPFLGPKLSSLPIQIHQIFLAIDLHDSACAVTGFHSIADLEAFLAWRLGLGGLGRRWGGSGS